jgi:uncharacterized membrane protein
MPEASAVAPSDAGLKATALLAYGLFALALVNGFTAIAGVIVVYMKRDEARGTVWEGHFRNLTRVFWISAVVVAIFLAVVLQGVGGLLFSLFATNGNPPEALVGGLLALLPALYLGAVIFLVWYLYRIVRGLTRALESRPY